MWETSGTGNKAARIQLGEYSEEKRNAKQTRTRFSTELEFDFISFAALEKKLFFHSGNKNIHRERNGSGGLLGSHREKGSGL